MYVIGYYVISKDCNTKIQYSFLEVKLSYHIYILRTKSFVTIDMHIIINILYIYNNLY